MTVLLALLLSIFPLAASYTTPNIWKRDGESTQPQSDPANGTGGFDELGQVDLLNPSAPVDNHNTTTTSPSKDALPRTCSFLESWYPPNFDMVRKNFATDCHLAVQHLYVDEVLLNAQSNMRTEFVAPTGSQQTTSWGENAQETTLIYQANTCTLAIMMLRTFANMTGAGTEQQLQQLLPGNIEPLSAMRSADTTTFRTLHRAGRMVEHECLERAGKAGWMAVGKCVCVCVCARADRSLPCPFPVSATPERPPCHKSFFPLIENPQEKKKNIQRAKA